MGGLFGGNSNSGSSAAAQNSTIGGITSDPAGRKISSGGFVDDGAQRMPSASDALTSNNAKKIRAQLVTRSGRAATDLTGTRSYVSPFLGSTQ
jgi:hypothetical protein